MIKFTQCSAVISVATLLALAPPFGYGENLDINATPADETEIISIDAATGGLSVLDMPSGFPSTLDMEPIKENSGGFSLFSIGDPGVVWNINPNVNYNNAFDSATTNHYYQFSIAQPMKITGRAWNLPSTSNLDIALWHQPEGATTWDLLTFSQVAYANEEQLSAVAEPGLYMFEVARITSLDVNPYNFNVTTTNLAVDSNEPNDNFWEATILDSYSSITATLDNDYDKDFYFFTTDNPITVHYSIQGGDFTATLYTATGTAIYNLPTNSTQGLNLPAGSYFWSIQSPSHDVSSGKSYTFGQRAAVDELQLNFISDEQTGYSQRVSWGQGYHFVIHEDAQIWGTALDANGDPIAFAQLQIIIESSVSAANNLVFYTTTDANGEYHKIIISPLGRGQYTRSGAALLYHFDLHKMHINYLNINNSGYEVAKIIQIDDDDEATSLNGYIELNDVAYYTN